MTKHRIRKQLEIFSGFISDWLLNAELSRARAPLADEIRVLMGKDGITVEFDIEAGSGLTVPFRGEFETNSSGQDLSEAAQRVAGIVASVRRTHEDITALLCSVESKAESIFAELHGDGGGMSLLTVRLRSFDPFRTDFDLAAEIEYQCLDAMARPRRTTIPAWDAVKFVSVLRQEHEHQKALVARRLDLDNRCAAGVVDDVTLAALNTLPDGRTAALRELARTPYISVAAEWSDEPLRKAEVHWHEGVVRLHGKLGQELDYHDGVVAVRGERCAVAAIGGPVAAYAQHACIAQDLIVEDAGTNCGWTLLAVADRLHAFDANGHILS